MKFTHIPKINLFITPPLFYTLMTHFTSFYFMHPLTNYCDFCYFYSCFNHHSCFTSNWFTTFIIHLPFFQRKFYFHILTYAISSISFQIKEGFFNFSCRDIFLVMNSFNFCLPGKLWSLLQFWMITYQIEDPWLEDFPFSNLSHHSLRPGKLVLKTCW